MHRPLRISAITLACVLTPVVLLAQVPKGATAKCKDGTYSTATSKQGMCSSHGGVAQLVSARRSATTRTATGSATTTSSAKAAPTRRTRSQAASASPSRAPVTASRTATARTTAPAKTAAAQELPTVAAPAGAPAGATAMCKDGTYSTSKVHTGACSHHGGVREWLQGSN
jgi:hypothetical protein